VPPRKKPRRPRGKRSRTTPAAAAQPGRSLLIRDLDQLKALTDPLRVRILQEFAAGASTAKEVARALGVKQGRLYHHIAVLEASGLLKVVGSRPVRGALEKSYRPAATRFEVDGSVFSAGAASGQDPAHAETVSSLLAQTRADLLDGQRQARLTEKGVPRPFLARMVFRGTPEAAASLLERLQNLLGECCGEETASEGKAEVLDFAVTIALCALPPGQPGKDP
jgi:DNA-binding transcriptional ArsR family regulator